MASSKGSKKTSRKTAPGANKASRPGSKVNAKGLEQYKWLIGGLFVLILLVLNWKIFVKNELKSDVIVQEISRFSGAEKSCGVFEAEDITPVGSDKFAITDGKNKRVLLFDRNNNFIRAWGKEGKGPEDFSGIIGITADDKENIYVIDVWSATIHGFDLKGKQFQSTLLNMGLYGPRGILWDNNNFIISDTGSHRLLRISQTGDLIEKWGTQKGDCKECLSNPFNAASDGKGGYYISDSDNNRVQHVAPGGKFLGRIDVGARPDGVAVDHDGNLYVCSAEGAFVKVYNSKGDYQGNLKEIRGQDMFTGVHEMSFAPDGTLLMVENDSVAQVKILPPGTKVQQ